MLKGIAIGSQIGHESISSNGFASSKRQVSVKWKSGKSMLNVINYGAHSGSPGHSVQHWYILYSTRSEQNKIHFKVLLQNVCMGLKDDRAVKQGVNKSWNQYLSRKKATKLNVHHLGLKWLQVNNNVQQSSQNKQCDPICVKLATSTNACDFGSKISFLLQLWPSLSLVIGNAKQIDCMEGNSVHILRRIFGFAAELEWCSDWITVDDLVEKNKCIFWDWNKLMLFQECCVNCT